MYILNLETATKNCSVALSKDGKTISSRDFAGEGYSHAEKLHVFIDEVLKESAIGYDELSAIAVSRGPGSYTGLRIGVSAAKGFCYALRIPLIAVDTLAVLAAQVSVQSGLIVPMIDARRMEVYSAAFDKDHQQVSDTKAEIITTESYSAIGDEIYFIGDCQPKLRDVLTKENFKFLDDVIYPSARDMSDLSYQKYQAGSFEDVAYFEPFYLKDFITGAKRQ